jgi:2,4-dienoyl-CoA reductase-like NADH-dependent reductase (Old Yellow Enzyme family)
MASIFSSLKIREITLKNRIAVSPMCQYSSIDGFANDWHLVHLGSRAVGGAGLVMTEASAVSPEGRITPADLGIWKDEHIDYLKKITSFIIQNDAVPGIQLAHAGRKASHTEPWNGSIHIPESKGGWKTVAPSSISFSPDTDIPEMLTKEKISALIENFKAAAKRALIAGFKIVEIHAAHGYLLNEFLSPLSNKRTDEYGGSFENRIRLPLEIVKAVRLVWPDDLPLFLRISASDWLPEGWSLDDSVAFAKILKSKGVDLIDCSSGGIVPDIKIPLTPGYQVPFAEQIKKETEILTGAVGLITEAEQAEDIISRGKADIVLLAREFLRDPYFPLHAAHELDENIKWPIQYDRAKRFNT